VSAVDLSILLFLTRYISKRFKAVSALRLVSSDFSRKCCCSMLYCIAGAVNNLAPMFASRTGTFDTMKDNGIA
jgi:hypothetical protein